MSQVIGYNSCSGRRVAVTTEDLHTVKKTGLDLEEEWEVRRGHTRLASAIGRVAIREMLRHHYATEDKPR